MMRNLFSTRFARSATRRVAFSTATVVHTGQAVSRVHQAPLLVAAIGAAIAISKTTTSNHCQVPCGIFDDPAMVGEVKQACQTVRKAMVQAKTLWSQDSKGVQSVNQVVRWINTKEEHCNKIIHLMGDYCLCQRVKRESFKSEADYLQALKLHHAVMQAAMKTKQSTDPAACDALEHAVADLAKMYS